MALRYCFLSPSRVLSLLLPPFLWDCDILQVRWCFAEAVVNFNTTKHCMYVSVEQRFSNLFIPVDSSWRTSENMDLMRWKSGVLVQFWRQVGNVVLFFVFFYELCMRCEKNRNARTEEAGDKWLSPNVKQKTAHVCQEPKNPNGDSLKTRQDVFILHFFCHHRKVGETSFIAMATLGLHSHWVATRFIATRQSHTCHHRNTQL